MGDHVCQDVHEGFGDQQRPRCYHCGKFMTDPQTESRRAERQVMRDFDRESRFHGGG